MIFDGTSRLNKNSNTKKDASKKHPTVHIDVYCTASDDNLETSSSSESEDLDSSLETVFKNYQSQISHRKATNTELPYSMKKLQKKIENCISLKGSEVDNDKDEENYETNSVTDYPSTCNSSMVYDFDSSCSTIFPSKPTSFQSTPGSSKTDILREKSYSDDILYKKYLTNYRDNNFTYDEKLNLKFISDRSNDSLQTVLPHTYENFDYEDSFDEERIKSMSNSWNKKNNQNHHLEHKNSLQIKKMKEYFNKRLISDKRKNFNSTNENHNLKNDSSLKTPITSETSEAIREPMVLKNNINPNYFYKAQKFGAVVGARKKPGHHIGPIRNPDCLCEHCREFYCKNNGFSREASPVVHNGNSQNWKNALRYHVTPKIL